MFTVVLRRFWRLCLFGLLASIALGARAAAPDVTTINGNPLTIRVGSDTSFQILNAENPGVGQMFPDSAEQTADMGWFIFTGGELYAPNFEEHPDGTATGGLAIGHGGPYQVLTPVSISGVTGNGTANDPYRVTVVSDAGATGLRATLQVSYVNGRNYYSASWTVRNTGSSQRAFKAFFGGDIYLADDDSGFPYFDTNSSSPGGRNCTQGDAQSDYYILLIPQTPVDAYAAKGYSEIWQLIGAGQLDNVVRDECIDNGAALQWNRTLNAGASTVLQTGTSFGAVPDIAQFNITEIQPNSGRPGQTLDVTLTGIGFFGSTGFEVGDGVTLSNVQLVNGTTATARLTIAGDATPGPRDVSGGQSAEGPFATLEDGFNVLDPEAPQSGSLQFNAASYSVNEGAGTLTVTVTRSNGSAGAASVHYASSNGSAQSGADYTAVEGTLQWADGETTARTFTVAISDDALVENNETFTLTLSGAAGATLGEHSTAAVTIVDNDNQQLPGQEGKVHRGGGALGLPLLAVLGLFATLRRKARRLAAPFAMLAAAVLPLQAMADGGEARWYGGVRAGLCVAGQSDATLTRALRRDGHVVNAEVDDHDIGGVLYAGWHWTPNADLELGYLHLGSIDARVDGDLDNGEALVRDLADALPAGGDGLLAALRLRFAIAGPLSFTPRLGAYWWTSETELRTAERRYSTRDRGLGIDAGLGFDLRLAQRLHLGLGGELLRSTSATAQQLYTLHVEYDF